MSFVAAKTFIPKLGNNYSQKTAGAILDFNYCTDEATLVPVLRSRHLVALMQKGDTALTQWYLGGSSNYCTTLSHLAPDQREVNPKSDSKTVVYRTLYR